MSSWSVQVTEKSIDSWIFLLVLATNEIVGFIWFYQQTHVTAQEWIFQTHQSCLKPMQMGIQSIWMKSEKGILPSSIGSLPHKQPPIHRRNKISATAKQAPKTIPTMTVIDSPWWYLCGLKSAIYYCQNLTTQATLAKGRQTGVTIILGFTVIADISGPYTPLAGAEVVPLPAQ